jgi:hypothetical protein
MNNIYSFKLTMQSFKTVWCIGSLLLALGMAPAHAGVVSTTPSSPVLNLLKGWNLVGNGAEASMTVASTFNDASKVTTLWKWVTSGTSAGISYPAWAFYAPGQADGGQAYAASKGYDFLTTINAGEGFWVNANQPFSSSLPAGNPVPASSFMPAIATPATAGGAHALPRGWSLIATGGSPTPSQLNSALTTALSTPPTAGQLYTNLTSLWAWDASQSMWYFWAPALVNNSTLAGYLTSKNYLDFATLPNPGTQATAGASSGTLAPTLGVWVNLP